METSPLQHSHQRFSIITLLFFLIAFVGILFYVKPLWDEVNTLALARDDKSQQKTQLIDKLDYFKRLQQKVAESSEVSKETSLSAIPEKLEQDALLTIIHDIASKNDIIVNGSNFSIPTNMVVGKMTKATINLNLTGDQDRLVNFLRGIETNNRKMLVKTIAVQFGKTAEGIKRANFNVSVDVYFLGII